MSDFAPMATVYGVIRGEVHLRIDLQNKCVALSIQITSALAAALAGTLLAKGIGTPAIPNQRLIFLLLFFFYGLVQSLIVTNYIYHTYFLLRLCAFIRDKMRERVKDVPGLLPGQLEGVSLPQDVAAFKTFAGRLIFRFQPLVVYASAAVGWVTVSVLLLWPPRPLEGYVPVLFDICGILVLWVSFAILWLLLREAHSLSIAHVLQHEERTIIP